MLEAEDRSTPWQRVLWLKQSQYPDNYLDETFLDNLQRNVNVRQYTYKGLVFDTMPVTQHLCSIMVFVALFTHLHENTFKWKTLVAVTLLSSLAGYLYWERLTSCQQFRSNVVASTFVLTAILLLLSPVLQTLSKATTSDSIWPLSASLFALNAILADYGSEAREPWQPIQFPSSLSVNAAISASVVLSSRLSSHLQVFALVLFSIEWFALFPILRKQALRSLPDRVNAVTTSMLALLALLLLAPLSPAVSALYTITILALQFGIPLWLLRLQSLKNELRGPWDAAVPKVAID
ncbi:phosphatidylinositol N-acetylglucosaminyltransferase [Cystobasidium minutum MCA 4210]|uniref:phosphatidylinositol N-acetylglucosaminyltransferase n=1 Tax=Cystobasidium minutum MCA 4210 TaxID=1397322 RepID=UPI0034CE2C30|eukprot:jgi/Rhomi1/78351/CE78350_266